MYKRPNFISHVLIQKQHRKVKEKNINFVLMGVGEVIIEGHHDILLEKTECTLGSYIEIIWYLCYL